MSAPEESIVPATPLGTGDASGNKPADPDDLVAFKDLLQVADFASECDHDAPPIEALGACRRASIGRRAAGTYQLLISGFGATVAAAVSRSLLETAMEKLWHEGAPTYEGTDLGVLAFERARLVTALTERGLSVPTLQRWLQPGPFERLNEVFTGPRNPSGKRLADKRKTATGNVLGASPAVADLLAMAGHANEIAAWCTVDNDDATSLGHRASTNYRALFAQVAGRGAAYALQGTTLDDLHDPVEHLTRVSRGIHQLNPTNTPAAITMAPATGTAHPHAVVPERTGPVQDELLDEVCHAYANFFKLLCQGPHTYANTDGQIHLSPVLPYLTCLSTAEVVLATATGRLPAEVGATAARMLVEEGARNRWLFGAGPDLTELRYAALRNSQIRARAVIRSKLVSHGTPQTTIAALLDPLPSAQVSPEILRTLPLGSDIVVPPHEQMRELGGSSPEPEWLTLAYNLLSQVTHATPLGLVHAVARDTAGEPIMSHEMTALSLDVAALGATATIAPLSVLLAMRTGQPRAGAWVAELHVAAAAVHNAARPVHFLD